MKLWISVVAVLLWLIPAPVYAATATVMTANGTPLGSMTGDVRDNHRVIDFDFGPPTTCQLTSITVANKSSSETFQVTSSNQQNQNLDGVRGTYITSRDAVIPVNLNEAWAEAVFNCNGNQVKASSQPLHFDDHPSIIPNSMPTRLDEVEQHLGEGVTVVINRLKSLWMVQQSSTNSSSPQTITFPTPASQPATNPPPPQIIVFPTPFPNITFSGPQPQVLIPTPMPTPIPTPTPTPNPTPFFIEGHTSGDGLFLHFNPNRNEWEWLGG